MDIKIETVLTITLVGCVLYYLMCRCDCREGLGNVIHGHVVDNKRMFDLRDLDLDPTRSTKLNFYADSPEPIVIHTVWMADIQGSKEPIEIKNERMITLLNALRSQFRLTSIGVEYDFNKWVPFVPSYKITVDMEPGDYRFWDWSGDHYDLTIHRTGKTHTIRYDSKDPRIVALYRNP